MCSEDGLIPISALQHAMFCERQVALIHGEQLWSHATELQYISGLGVEVVVSRRIPGMERTRSGRSVQYLVMWYVRSSNVRGCSPTMVSSLPLPDTVPAPQ